MGYEKPISEQDKQKANTLYRHMLHNNGAVVTKEEVCRLFSLSNEKAARDVIKLVGVKVPVISYSTKKGYRLAKSGEDIADVDHTLFELFSRIEELFRRAYPLIDFKKKYPGGVELSRMIQPILDLKINLSSGIG